MNFHVVTLFPEVVDAYAQVSILGRAQKTKSNGVQGKNLLSVQSYQLRDFVTNPVKLPRSHGAGKWAYKKVDERPYGGGPGMVLLAEPFVRAVENLRKKNPKAKIIITAAGGKPLTNAYAKSLIKHKDVIILCGRYEGIDARVKKILKAEEVSVGPYILTGGELPALTIIDATARQIPGVLGKFESLEEGRVASHEMYTRPEVLEWKDTSGKVKKYKVPKVLLSGNHASMNAWKDKKRSEPI